jgi:hypothetical protein
MLLSHFNLTPGQVFIALAAALAALALTLRISQPAAVASTTSVALAS